MKRNTTAGSQVGFPASEKCDAIADRWGKLETIYCDNASHFSSTEFASLMMALKVRFSEKSTVDARTVEKALCELRGSGDMMRRRPLMDISDLEPRVAAARFRYFGLD
ncbi:hypothetical protein [Agrobacterium cavarae]|uniref:hypothetical protein n=1 Tax=Agrobacterium cavarae TaxID=2528239 RepID=UPI0028A7AC90|nr:hypothetical protein [Agrobacterium cavarae]